MPFCGFPGEPVDEAPPLDGCVPYTAPVVVPDVDVPDVDVPDVDVPDVDVPDVDVPDVVVPDVDVPDVDVLLGFVEEPLFCEPLATPFNRF